MKLRDVLQKLQAAGFEVVSQNKHIKVRKGKITTTIPAHREIKSGTLRAIEKQTGVALR